jgi:NAD(P)-dependent dehydrogenase (short-subunit alcohol dehydrogenase family)
VCVARLICPRPLSQTFVQSTTLLPSRASLAQGSAATKATIIQFTRVIGHQYARSGIRATLILPG